MSTRLITLIRHGKVDGPAGLYGRTDIALSNTGRNDLQQALNNVHQQTSITQVISSPLQRCASIAHIFSTQYGLPLFIKTDLQEMDFGRWDGVAFDALGDEWNNLMRFWESPSTAHAPEGERLQDFSRRVINAWQQLICSTDAAHQAIICHGGVIRIIIAHILKLDIANPGLFQQLHIDYASNTRIEITSDSITPVIKWIAAPVTSPSR